MKNNRYFLFAAAILVLASCVKEAPLTNTPQNDEQAEATITFKASMPETKAVMGVNDDNQPQVFWENGDQITIYSEGVAVNSKETGFVFTTSLTDNATSATFSYTGTGFDTGDYMAIYPASTEARQANFTGEGDIYKMAAVDVPNTQKLVAGSFDKSAAVMTAFAPEGSTALSFKNAVALLKFQVSDANVKYGSIVVNSADHISGRFRADLSTTEPYEPVLSPYNAGGVIQYNFVDFSLGGSALATGTDYYVAVRPTALTSGLKIYLDGILVKSFTAAQVAELKRNKIYNLGTLAVPAAPAEKVLNFDFTCAPLDGWPTTADTRTTKGLECVYPLYGTNYSLVLSDLKNAKSPNIYWSESSTASYCYRIVFAAQLRYLGLPAIPGWKLSHVICSSAQLNSSTGSTKAKVGIVSNVVDQASDPTYVTGGELRTWAAGNKHERYDYALSGTAANTMYYLFASVKGALAYVSATYVPE